MRSYFYSCVIIVEILERCIIADDEIEKKFNELMHSGKNPVCQERLARNLMIEC